MRKGIFCAVFLAGLLAGPASAASEPKGAKKEAKKEEVQKSTAPAQVSISSVYRVEKMRDPFMKVLGGGAPRKDPGTEPKAFSIHDLALRAIMKDHQTGYALFSDTVDGSSYIFRKGRLYNRKNKRVAGVMGVLSIKRRSVKLFTRDKDSKQFRLGQDEEE